MIFNSFSFVIIFPILFLGYYLIPSGANKLRNIYLLIVSYLLYMKFSALAAVVLFGVTLITYLFALGFRQNVKHKKIIVSIGVVLSILPLAIFKYADFLTGIVDDLFDIMGVGTSIPGLNWIIPIGISFFTFQSVGYLIDVYRQKIEPERDFINYALFISFFPSIVSGPINKASLLLPQIKNERTYFDYAKAVCGLKLLLWGMFMKVVVADRVGLYVDTVYVAYQNYSGITCFVASVLYSIQIYADFAGYSLMALGIGKVLGFELTENFKRPYFSTSVTSFWRRWHMSLSTWLKDYIFISLGGSRCSKIRNYWNILVTFFVSGIWHGAGWSFIMWGLMHGVCQIVEKIVGQNNTNYLGWRKTIKIAITFLIVNFAWIFFRFENLSDALLFIERIFTVSGILYLPEKANTVFILLGVGMLLLKDVIDEFYPNNVKMMDNKNSVIRWFSYISIFVIIMLCGVFDAGQFIYANF